MESVPGGVQPGLHPPQRDVSPIAAVLPVLPSPERGDNGMVKGVEAATALERLQAKA
jgi:hypothetical protein